MGNGTQRTEGLVEEMNVNMLTAEERNNFIKEGACFKCQKRGHIAKNCPSNKERILVTQAKKSTVKDLVAQVHDKGREDEVH